METASPPSTLEHTLQESKTFEELLMKRSLRFSDSLKELKNLRSQLYRAADYFELSFLKDNHKKTVIVCLKDYTAKALVTTIDHLGSLSCKIIDLLSEKVNEVSRTELSVSCIEQKVQSCQELANQEGVSQQFPMLMAPKYHKQYNSLGSHSSVGESVPPPILTSLRQDYSKQHELHRVESKARDRQVSSSSSKSSAMLLDLARCSKSGAMLLDPSSPSLPKGCSALPAQLRERLFRADRTSTSRLITSNPRSGSFTARPTQRKSEYYSSLGKSSSMRLYTEKNKQEGEENSKKGKRTFKYLFTKHKD